MAARTRKLHHNEDTRAKIQTSQLLNRLNDHAFSKAKLSLSQIKAIEILLRKSLPDLSALQLSGDAEKPLETRIERVIVGQPEAPKAHQQPLERDTKGLH